jgi:hypothetical protein
MLARCAREWKESQAMKLRNATLAVLLASLSVASVQAGESDSLARHESRGRSALRTGLSLRRAAPERHALRRFRHPEIGAALAGTGSRSRRAPAYFAVALPSRWQRHLADVQPPAV